MRHKHADLIHAWAEGAEIEYLSTMGYGWRRPGGTPLWDESETYRIKPEKKPDVVRYVNAYLKNTCYLSSNSQFPEDNLRCTFCGDTGKLIKAEIL